MAIQTWFTGLPAVLDTCGEGGMFGLETQCRSVQGYDERDRGCENVHFGVEAVDGRRQRRVNDSSHHPQAPLLADESLVADSGAEHRARRIRGVVFIEHVVTL